MKTTVELPDELLIAAKKRAAETRTSLRKIFERALRREIQQPGNNSKPRRKKIKWYTSPGGLPADLDLSNREKMYEWFERHKDDCY